GPSSWAWVAAGVTIALLLAAIAILAVRGRGNDTAAPREGTAVAGSAVSNATPPTITPQPVAPMGTAPQAVTPPGSTVVSPSPHAPLADLDLPDTVPTAHSPEGRAHSCESGGMAQRIVILTGAGVSAESGVRTFRASDGLWEEHRIEDVATPQGFDANP